MKQQSDLKSMSLCELAKSYYNHAFYADYHNLRSSEEMGSDQHALRASRILHELARRDALLVD